MALGGFLYECVVCLGWLKFAVIQTLANRMDSGIDKGNICARTSGSQPSVTKETPREGTWIGMPMDSGGWPRVNDITERPGRAEYKTRRLHVWGYSSVFWRCTSQHIWRFGLRFVAIPPSWIDTRLSRWLCLQFVIAHIGLAWLEPDRLAANLNKIDIPSSDMIRHHNLHCGANRGLQAKDDGVAREVPAHISACCAVC